MLSESEETSIIKRAVEGDQQAFRQLYDNHADALFAFMLQFADNREQSKEWTQRAFIKAFDKIKSFKSKSRFRTWLFTIALNEMRTDMRKPIQFVELHKEKLEASYLDVPGETEEIICTETRNAIRDLAPDKKIILLLHVAENYTHSEIGDMLQISEEASRITLYRARKELKQVLNT